MTILPVEASICGHHVGWNGTAWKRPSAVENDKGSGSPLSLGSKCSRRIIATAAFTSEPHHPTISIRSPISK